MLMKVLQMRKFIMQNKIVGPYVMQKVNLYLQAKNDDDVLLQEEIIACLMSRPEYRQSLQVNYPQVWDEVKQYGFLYNKRG